MSTHNICLHGEIRKLFFGYPLLYGAMKVFFFFFFFFFFFIDGVEIFLFITKMKALIMSTYNKFHEEIGKTPIFYLT